VETLNTLIIYLEVKLQRTLYNNLLITKIFVIKNLHIVLFFEFTIYTDDLVDLLLRNLIALFSQAFAHFFIVIDGINELNFPFTPFGFIIRQNPDISGNTSVVEKVIRHCHNTLYQVIFNHIASYLAFSAACIPCE